MAIHNIILPDDDAITRRAIFVLNQKKKIKYNWIITGEIKEVNEKLVFFSTSTSGWMKKEKKAKVNIYRRNTYDISQTLEGVVGAVYNMKISGEDGRLLDRFTRTVVPGRLRSGGEARIGTIRSCWKSFFQEEKKRDQFATIKWPALPIPSACSGYCCWNHRLIPRPLLIRNRSSGGRRDRYPYRCHLVLSRIDYCRCYSGCSSDCPNCAMNYRRDCATSPVGAASAGDDSDRNNPNSSRSFPWPVTGSYRPMAPRHSKTTTAIRTDPLRHRPLPFGSSSSHRVTIRCTTSLHSGEILTDTLLSCPGETILRPE